MNIIHFGTGRTTDLDALSPDWAERGFSTFDAVAWREAGFLSREAAEWRAAGHTRPALASYWMRYGFLDPVEAHRLELAGWDEVGAAEARALGKLPDLRGKPSTPPEAA